jgi:autotransporter passenger strand-loop-strand repeat protein
MTTLYVNLSPTLSATLSQSGTGAHAGDHINAYAVFFSGATVSATPLVTSSVVVDGGSAIPVDLPSYYKGGKVYFIIQSVASGGTDLTFGPSGNIKKEGDLNWQNAQALDFRFDSFEVSLEGKAGDQGNLTEIQGFGIPMEVSVQSGSVTQLRGYRVDGNQIFQEIGAIHDGQLAGFTYNQGPLDGQPRMALSPTEAIPDNLPGASPTDWLPYLESLEHTSGIRIAGYFNGATDANGIWHNGGNYAYDLSYVGPGGSSGYFLLTPEDNSQIKGGIQISVTDLANSIYSTLGNVNILNPISQGSETVYSPTSVYLADMNTGANNEWGGSLVKFLVGFIGGYYGGTGSSLNPLLTSSLDLNNNWNFDPTYAFGGTPGGPSVTFAPGISPYADPYAEVFFNNANAYGNTYQDGLMNAFLQGGPLVNVGTPSGDVSSITITLFDDSDANALMSQGYTGPVINNLNKGPYVTPLAGQGNTSTLTMQFDFGVGQYSLNSNVSATLNFYTGTSAGVAHFEALSFTLPESQGSATLFQFWNYNSGLHPSLSATGPLEPAGGTLVVSGLPYATGVNWYQLTVASGSTSRTYDYYLDAVAGSGVLNPIYGTTDQSGSVATDNLATYLFSSGSSQYVSSVTFQMANGGTVTLDPGLLGPVTTATAISSFQQPQAPVLGRRSGVGGFSELYLPVSTTVIASGPNAGQLNPPPAQTVVSGALYFGWMGADSSVIDQPAHVGLIGGYTNKIAAQDVASLTVFSAGTSVAHATATADLDGNWFTMSGLDLGAGTYSVTMTEYSGGVVVGRESAPQSFTVVAGGTVSDLVTVGPGQTSAGLTVVAGGTLTVDSGGFAVATEISGGVESVTSSGVDSGASVVTSGGGLFIGAGGSSFAAMIVSGGSAVVSSGGVTTAAVLGGGGVESVTSGGIASATVILSGGQFEVDTGGTASNTLAMNGGVATATSGTWISTILSSGGRRSFLSVASHRIPRC